MTTNNGSSTESGALAKAIERFSATRGSDDARIKALEARLRFVERQLHASGGNRPAGRCVHCADGILLRENGVLWCTNCSYARYL